MTEQDKQAFTELMRAMGLMYGRKRSDVDAMAPVYWQALKRFEFAEVRRAFSMHAQDTDVGQYWPKIGDVLRQLEGRSETNALRAWTKVEQAIRRVGGYQDVVFDDPIIHAVISDMGGWVSLCSVTEDELPFRAREFMQRYRGYLATRRVADYPARLTGIANAHNARHGFRQQPPVLLGDPELAQRVLEQGGQGTGTQITRAGDLVEKIAASMGARGITQQAGDSQ